MNVSPPRPEPHVGSAGRVTPNAESHHERRPGAWITRVYAPRRLADRRLPTLDYYDRRNR